MIELINYYNSTTATSTSAGGVAGYYEETFIEQGQDGTPIPQETWTYIARSAGDSGPTIYPTATDTVYTDTSGDDAETTSYTYTWYSGTVQPQTITITLPTVSSDDNGPDTAASTVDFYNLFNQVVWSKDATGNVDYTSYDIPTGAVTETITDVNYSDLTSNQQACFELTGWSEPSGLNLVTTMVVDGLGRTTEVTDPDGNVTYTVYDDVDHEVRVYPGWNSTTDMPTGPTLVTRYDMAGSYTETLTMSVAPQITGTAGSPDAAPNGGEDISDIQSLIRSYTSDGGQVVEVDQYYNLSGVTYSDVTYIGSSTSNYAATTYGYNALGLEDHVVDASGTITDTDYDSRGRVDAIYVGTNDTSSNNMVEVSSDQYDDNGVGDGDLTQLTTYPDSSSSDNRVTVNLYDWRDRLISTKSGVQSSEDDDTNRPLVVYTLDNLGEATQISTYNGDGIAMTDSGQDGIPTSLDSATLVAQITNYFDSQGRIYKTEQADIDQATGDVLSDPLMTQMWYDMDGRIITQESPNGQFTKWQYDGAGRVISVSITNGAGGATWADASSFTYDVVLQQVSYLYDADGNVIQSETQVRDGDDDSTTGALGGDDTAARTTYMVNYYDAAGRVTATADFGTEAPTTDQLSSPSTDTGALVTSTQYDAAGLPSEVIQPAPYSGAAQPTTSYAYDAEGNVTRMTDPDGNTTTYAYDAEGHLTQMTVDQSDGLPNQTTQYNYGVTGGSGHINSNNLLASVESPNPSTGDATTSNAVTYTYDNLGEVLTATQPNGAVDSTTYNVLGQVTEDEVTTTDGSGDPTTQFTYDTLGNVNSQTDALGNTTDYYYNSLGEKREMIQPPPSGSGWGLNTSYAYDAAGNLTSVTDPLGNVTSYTYDLLNQMTEEIDPAPTTGASQPTTTYAYDVSGQYDTVTDPLGNTTTTVYDQFGRTAQVIQPAPYTDAAQPTTSYAYDADGNVTSVTDPDGNTTSYVYDAMNRKIEEIDPIPASGGGGSHPTTSYTYDAVGNLLTEKDPDGNTTTYTYDALNRQTQEIDPAPTTDAAQPTTTYGYDISGNLTSVTDADGNTTTYTYNQLNQETSEVDPAPTTDASQPTTTYAYDLDGNLTKVTDPMDQVTEYTYDHLNRKTAEKWLNSESEVTQTISYAYDADGRLTSVSDPNSTTTYAYDADGNAITIDTAYADVTNDVIEHQSFDLDGDRTTLAVDLGTTPDLVETFAYDHDGNMTQVVQTDSSAEGADAVAAKLANFTYDAAGNMTGQSLYSNTLGTDLVASTTNSYDYDNRLTSISDALGSTGSTTVAYSFAYDAASLMTTDTTPDGTSTLSYDHDEQLLSATSPGEVGTNETYAYDAEGDRETDTEGTGATGSVTVNYDNQVTSEDGTTYTYNAAGDMTSQTNGALTTDYAWDYRNRLTQVTLKNDGTTTQTIDYLYDPGSNNRIGETVRNGSGDITLDERFVYDASTGNLLMVLDVSAEDGSAPVVARYLYGPNNQVLAQESISGGGSGSGAVSWALTDQDGSVTYVLNSSGGVADHIIYDSYGNVVSGSDNIGIGYSGYILDVATGLDYDHARYYDPVTGTFISQDPSGLAGGTTDLYQYVGNNPATNTDPTGLCAESAFNLNSVEALRNQLIASGVSPAEADQILNPYYQALVQQGYQQAQAQSQAANPYSIVAQLESLGSSFTNSISFGGSDKLGLTHSASYQAPGFIATQVAGAVAGQLALFIGTAGVGTEIEAGLGLSAEATELLGSAARAYTTVQSAAAIGAGASNIANGNYGAGIAQVATGFIGFAAVNGPGMEEGPGLSEPGEIPTEPELPGAPGEPGSVGQTPGAPANEAAEDAAGSGRVFYGTPQGQLIEAPPGYEADTALNGKGLVLQPEGQTLGDNSNIIRWGEPDAQNPDGYFRYYNDQGQPLNPATGQPGPDPITHIPPDYQGPLNGYPGR